MVPKRPPHPNPLPRGARENEAVVSNLGGFLVGVAARRLARNDTTGGSAIRRLESFRSKSSVPFSLFRFAFFLLTFAFFFVLAPILVFLPWFRVEAPVRLFSVMHGNDVSRTAVVSASHLLLASTEPLTDSHPRRLTAGVEGDGSAALLRLAVEETMVRGEIENRRGARIASTLSASKLGIDGLYKQCLAPDLQDKWPEAKTWFETLLPAPVPARVTGPATTCIGACATGFLSLIRGVQMIEWDEADIVLTGAAEGTLNELVLAGFDRMGVLSRTRPRPFDLRRDGFVPCEGAGVILLERESDARADGRAFSARILGYAQRANTTSAYGGTADGEAIAELALAALNSAGLETSDLHYVHLHGTGTQINDAAEADALRLLFDSRGVFVPASSTKGLTGHCLGAAGAVELLLTIDALHRGLAPATTGCETIDPSFRTDCILTRDFPLEGNRALLLSYGFGGPMTALVVEAVEGRTNRPAFRARAPEQSGRR
ncbi:MAG: hypothetical protein D6679_11010 [Candidatus Hydrogenedentota bacterium]|nr:MAG: hypothetical protein D6679_11010 [Candidatus Hydrogenedentota bacterium]